jgi:hypothetical protein
VSGHVILGGELWKEGRKRKCNNTSIGTKNREWKNNAYSKIEFDAHSKGVQRTIEAAIPISVPTQMTTIVADTFTPTLEGKRRSIHGCPEGALQSRTPLAAERPTIGRTDPVLPALQLVLAGKFTAQILESHAVTGIVAHVRTHHSAAIGKEADSMTIWKEQQNRK